MNKDHDTSGPTACMICSDPMWSYFMKGKAHDVLTLWEMVQVKAALKSEDNE